jgi:hypothetical protein
VSNDRDLFPAGPLELPGEPSRNPMPRPPKQRRLVRKKWLVAGVGVISLIGLGAGAWSLWGRNPQSAQPSTNQEAVVSSEEPETVAASSDVAEATEQETFKTDHPRVEFRYPTSWTVTESDNGVRIESPDFTYQTIDGETVTGYFRIYIRQGARSADSTYIGRGIAVQPSEKLVYSEPAPGQRPETNLTQFGLDTPDHFAYFFIAGNYALQQGETLGPGYGKEAETYIIAGGYSSKELADDLATHKVSLEYYQQTNAYRQAVDIIKSLKVL